MIKIKFCGAAQEVTGSAHLVTLPNSKKILLDCGLYQGVKKEMEDFNSKWSYFDPSELDCVIVSHAHIDHIGRLPKLVKDGFKGEIYCTHATRSLANIMLLDAAKIQEEEADDEHPVLYTADDVRRTMERFVGVNYEHWHLLGNGARVFFRDAGHILGSATVTLEITYGKGNRKYLGFTGDVGRPQRPILRDPIPMPKVDYLLCESTYGDREHPAPFIEAEQLLQIVEETCVKNKGKLLIPAFSVGRTQELIYLLEQLWAAKKLPKVPIYIDSPLAISAVDVFKMHPECYDDELHEYMLNDPNPFGFQTLNYVRMSGLADRLADSKDPCIVISAAGMMNAGRVRRHLYHFLPNPRNTVLIISYCAPHTLGGLIRTGAPSVRLFGAERPIHAQVKIMDSFSAHADRKELVAFMRNQRKLSHLILVHGEPEPQQHFKTYLQENGFDGVEIHIPALGDEIELP